MMVKRERRRKVTKRCTRCVLPDTYPGITFNQSGICNLCLNWENRKEIDYVNQEEELKEVVEKHRKENKKSRYDCVLGVSGGKDSTYAMYYLSKVLKLKVLAVNFSVGFNSLTAQANILKAIDKLGIDLFALRIEWEKLRQLYSIFLRHTGGLCIPCNTQKIRALKMCALIYGIKIIFSGVSAYDFGSVRYDLYTNESLKEILSKEMSTQEIEEFLIPSSDRNEIKYYHLDRFVKWDQDKAVSTIEKELGWKNPTKSPSQKGYYRFAHTDCDWFPMDCYLRWKSCGFDRLTMSNSIRVRKGEMTRVQALKRETEVQKMGLPSYANKLLKRIGISIKDIKGL